MAADGGFQYLLEKVKRNKGVDFGMYRTGTLERRIGQRLQATGCQDYMDYVACLNREPEEYDRLVDAVTINVTEFFRDPAAFKEIHIHIIPAIIKRKNARGSRTIRVWSAGSSVGEETYSLAILFLEALERYKGAMEVRIQGTDMDPRAIAKAEEGIYKRDRVQKIDPKLLSKYFTSARDEAYEVKQPLRAVTRFRTHNLVSDPYPVHMDLILCRNVLIYFTPPLQELTQNSFHKSLTGGGFLVLGKVESLSSSCIDKFNVFHSIERIYQKKEEQSQ